jgi:hypothetical protein
MLTFRRAISMVHARAFCFTDDSTSVTYPSIPSNTVSGPVGTSIVGPQSLDTALILFQLRYVQSCWYQELFQSNREPLPQGLAYIWQTCQEMREWSESFPDSLPLAFKDFFDLELLYSYVYCLAPSCRVSVVSDYAKTLIFEYSIAYMQKIFPISRDPVNTAFYTYHDALRVYFVGSQFLAVLSERPDQLLNGIQPYSQPTSGSPPPPPLPDHNGSNNVSRSLNCITHIKETLRTFGLRWDDSQALLSSFESQAEPLQVDLHQRRHHANNISQSMHAPNFIAQHVYDHMGNVIPNDWANLSRGFVGINGVQGVQGRPP